MNLVVDGLMQLHQSSPQRVAHLLTGVAFQQAGGQAHGLIRPVVLDQQIDERQARLVRGRRLGKLVDQSKVEGLGRTQILLPVVNVADPLQCHGGMATLGESHEIAVVIGHGLIQFTPAPQ